MLQLTKPKEGLGRPVEQMFVTPPANVTIYYFMAGLAWLTYRQQPSGPRLLVFKL